MNTVNCLYFTEIYRTLYPDHSIYPFQMHLDYFLQARCMLGYNARLSNIWKTRKRCELSDGPCGPDVQAAYQVRMQGVDFTHQHLIWASVFIRDLCVSGFREAGFEIILSFCPACLSHLQRTFLIIYL